MRVLTDQAETGAVTIALPQDVQAEAFDWPEELFAKRVWHIPPPAPDPAAVARAVEVLRSARKPLIVAGGGLLYSEATEQLRRFAEATGIPVADTQAGKGSILWDHPQAVGGVGSTGSPVANALARDADVVLGIGTRYSDFTTASQDRLPEPGRAVRQPQRRLAGRRQAVRRPAGRRRPPRARGADRGARRLPRRRRLRAAHTEHKDRWNGVVDEAFHLDHQPLPAQTEMLGALNEQVGPDARGRPGGRQHARRPADAVARAGPEAVPRRVRGSRAWATRSPVRWASRWPPRSARSTPSSATGRT